MPNPEIPSGDNSKDRRSEFLKKVIDFFDDPLVNEPKDFISRIRDEIRLKREGKSIVRLCEGITRDDREAQSSSPVPLVESDADLEDLIDLREEITGDDFKLLYRDSFEDRS